MARASDPFKRLIFQCVHMAAEADHFIDPAAALRFFARRMARELEGLRMSSPSTSQRAKRKRPTSQPSSASEPSAHEKADDGA
jgi:hypothetical protein